MNAFLEGDLDTDNAIVPCRRHRRLRDPVRFDRRFNQSLANAGPPIRTPGNLFAVHHSLQRFRG